jgi:hypothetical protein
MNLFQLGNFTLHSGEWSGFKIECDGLTEHDWATLAFIVSQRFVFSNVIGIPRGGLLFAEALKPYASNRAEHPWLLVDDVLNTGGSMELERYKLSELGKSVYGVVAFARRQCPDWIHPVFNLWPNEVVAPWKPKIV